VAVALCLTSTSGASAVTVIDSVTPTRSVWSTFRICPSSRLMLLTVLGLNPDSVAVTV
jgi:hypothetical protein